MTQGSTRRSGRGFGWAFGAVAVLLLAGLVFWSTPAKPVAWAPPANAGYTGPHAPNARLAPLQHYALAAGQTGPEFITARHGVLYTGLINGEVLRLGTDGQSREVITNTGGRPLGLDLDHQGRVVVADAIRGLLRITGRQQAKVETLLTTVDEPVRDDPIRYADAVKVAPDGTIWLTDATRRFSVREMKSTFEASVLDIMEHSCTGRLIALDPITLRSRVALSDLCFPNGLELSGDGKTMYLSETGSYRILKINLSKLSVTRTLKGTTGVPSLDLGVKQGAISVLVDNLPGYPDNLTRGAGGRIWVGLTKPRSALTDLADQHAWLRALTLRLPRVLWPVPPPYGHVIAFDEDGKVVDDLQDPKGAYPETTSATEADGKLFIQSLNATSIGWLPYDGPKSRP